MNNIERFEALAERLVEGTFARLFAGRLSPLEVAMHLARALDDQQVTAPDGTAQAPTHFRVYLHPEDHAALTAEQPTMEEELSRHVSELAAQANMALEVTPVIQVLSDPNLSPRNTRIEARWMPENWEHYASQQIEKTTEIGRGEDTGGPDTTCPRGRPFLIIEGKRNIDLIEATVSIGRAPDNTLILEDPRVSRHHAQLRQRYGHYVLYDLSSTGGTQINNYPVEECVLHSGDVISFAGVQVVYGEDPPPPAPALRSGDTPALSPEDTRPA